MFIRETGVDPKCLLVLRIHILNISTYWTTVNEMTRYFEDDSSFFKMPVIDMVSRLFIAITVVYFLLSSGTEGKRFTSLTCLIIC